MKKHLELRLLLCFNLIFCGILALSMIIVPYFSRNQFYIYTQSEKPSTSGFPPERSNEQPPIDETDRQSLTVYCDISSNMLGFVTPQRANCVKSTYLEMLNYLESTFDSRSITFRAFSDGSLSNMTLDALTAGIDYAASSAYSSGLELVLQQAAISKAPVIILTDLEGTMLDSSVRVKLETQFISIFSARKSVSVTRYVSAYSGRLVNYAGSNSNYAYGYDPYNESLIKPSEWSKIYHRLPRGFYAIIISDTETCEDITNNLNNLYDTINSSLSSDHENPALDLYKQRDTIRYSTIKADLLQGYRPGEATETGIWVDNAALTPEDIAASQWKDSYGVYQFMLKRDEATDGVFNIPFTIRSRLISDNQAPTAALTTTSVQSHLLRIGEIHERVDESNQARLESGDWLLARGDRAIRLDLLAEELDEKCFRAVTAMRDDQTIELNFSVDPTLILPGVYRIELKVTAQQNRALMNDRIEQVLSPYSITEALASSNASALSSNTRRSGVENPILRTVGLQYFLTALSNGYVSHEVSGDLEIADIILDLYVE